ncbi:MAG: rhodanese-like domain-containing protein [Rhodoferax sp.]|nr:rhodanese-like domain-containing protein [Rhodoferax sp.]MCF8208270.1 rhodanese-like domain-containing protein [Rhodoferax sp.]
MACKPVLVLLTWIALLAPGQAAEPELLRMIGQSKQFIVQTPSGPFTITRNKTACAFNKGALQPLVPLPGVQPVTEIEVLHALNDPATMVIDMRDEEDPLDATIPNSYHIPYNEIEDRMGEVGCVSIGKNQWDCAQAARIVAFCYGPMCLQSPAGITNLVRMGFPVGKIAYYRGGLMDWEALGLTTVRGSRPTLRK